MEQAQAFLEESQDLDVLIQPLDPESLGTGTAFKGWTFQTILRHLHFWNEMALWALQDSERLQVALAPVVSGMQSGVSLPELERQQVNLAGLDLVAAWRGTYQQLAAAYGQADPSQRCPWVGPSMSARSCITARQMETWAHGQAIYDELGQTRQNTDRIKNVVVLGINTFNWTFQVRGEQPPEPQPHVSLRAPSGELWEFGDPDSTARIDGTAEEFAQVVTQTRHVEDTSLQFQGEPAQRWLYNAQCFAGGANPPPSPGSRRRKVS